MLPLQANYHTHTWRCGHATGADRDYLDAAIGAGLKTLGISDHGPMIFPSPQYPPDYYSGFRMLREHTAGYFHSFSELRQEARDRLEILIGLEIEYYPDCFPLFLDYISAFPLDYLILGQHFTGHEQNGIRSFEKTAAPDDLRAYYDGVLQAVKTGCFLYIAHPDVFKFTGDEAAYAALTRRFLEAAKPYDPLLEINRLGLFDGRIYPRPAFWKIAGELGYSAIVGLDAHAPSVFADGETPRRCVELARTYGLRLVTAVKNVRFSAERGCEAERVYG